MRNWKNIAAVVLVAMCLGNIAIQCLSGSPLQGLLFHNADALYLPTLFTDLFAKGGHLNDWYLTPAPYFFPDFAIFSLAYLVGTEPTSQIIAYALIQVTLTFFAIWFLARQSESSAPILTAAALTALLTYYALRSEGILLYLLTSAIHFGSFITGTLLCAVWIKCSNETSPQRKRLLCFVMMILTFAVTLSDKIFLAQFIAPLIATQLLFTLLARDISLKGMNPLIAVALAAALGAASYQWVVRYPIRFPARIGTVGLIEDFAKLCDLISSSIRAHPSLGIVLLLYVLIAVYTLMRVFKKECSFVGLNWLVVFSVISVVSTLGSVLLEVNLQVLDRYLFPALFWPVIVLAIFVAKRLRDRFVPVAMAISILAMGSMSRTSYELAKANGIQKSYYPEDIACVDRVLQNHGLVHGIAQYWDAKYFQNFSKAGVTLAQYNEDLVERRWITSRKSYRPTYDFAVISEDVNPDLRFAPENLSRLNGAPKAIEKCGNKFIYVYGKDKISTSKIVNVGDTYVWKGCELSTRIGEQTANCAMDKKTATAGGFLTFGPYVVLPAGQYAFEISYSSSAEKDVEVGSWDVTFAFPYQGLILKRGTLVGTNGTLQALTNTFIVDAEKSKEQVEIRTLARPTNDLTVNSLQITRIQ